MTIDLPATQRALVLHSYATPLEHALTDLAVEERPVRSPAAGEVAVCLAAAAVNPSDLTFVQGQYGVRKPLPVVPGFEGSGTVAAAGPGAEALLGRRVACFAGDGDGTWAEYVTTGAASCFPLPDAVNDEQGAMALVNPLTAFAQVEIAREAGATAIAQTAAAGALGRMVQKFAADQGIAVLNIVRRADQADLLRSLGAEHVLISSADPEFERQLREQCRALNVRLAFDAVGGALTGALLAALPNRSRVVLYGALDRTAVLVRPGDLIFRDQSLGGFYLSRWLSAQPPATLLRAQAAVAALLIGQPIAIQRRARLEEARDALAAYAGAMTAGKLIFVPGR